MNKNNHCTCQICRKTFSIAQLVPAQFVRAPIAEMILAEHSGWSQEGYICHDDLNRYRCSHVQQLLTREKGALSDLEREVIASLREHDILSRNTGAVDSSDLTLGQRLADRVASFGGSWKFILIFGGVLTVWIAINSVAILSGPFDPFPFILLNLVLSCLAAMQAPVIMMSQNRQESKDRLRAENDYRINLKAELEIRHLHAKMDLLVTDQWQRLLEIQQVQTDLLSELGRNHTDGKKRSPQ